MEISKIESNIPVSEQIRRKAVVSKYPFLDMKIGDSFLVTDLNRSDRKIMSSVRNSLLSITDSRNLTMKVSCRRISDHSVRCWRTE